MPRFVLWIDSIPEIKGNELSQIHSAEKKSMSKDSLNIVGCKSMVEIIQLDLKLRPYFCAAVSVIFIWLTLFAQRKKKFSMASAFSHSGILWIILLINNSHDTCKNVNLCSLSDENDCLWEQNPCTEQLTSDAAFAQRFYCFICGAL